MSNAEKHKSLGLQSTEIKPVNSEINQPEVSEAVDDSISENKKLALPYKTESLVLEKNLREKSIYALLIASGIYVGISFFEILPTNPDASSYYRTTTLVICSAFFIFLFKLFAAFLMKEGTSLVKDKVPNRISAAKLRVRWGRVVKHDFINVILETKMNIYLRSELRPENVLRSKRFYSQFFPQKERTNILFDERCFFDLDQVEEVEQKYPRLWAGEHSLVGKLSLEIEELKKEIKSYQTQKARLTIAQNKLDGAHKEGFFLANMVLEMVKDPTSLQSFSHKEYKAIADKVQDKEYIQKLSLNRPTDELIKIFRVNLPLEFRNEGNSPK